MDNTSIASGDCGGGGGSGGDGGGNIGDVDDIGKEEEEDMKVWMVINEKLLIYKLQMIPSEKPIIKRR